MSLSTTLSDIKDRILGREEEDVDTTPETPIESIPTRPTRGEVLDAIISETGCSRSQAGNALTWITDIVEQARADGYMTYYPTERQMGGRNYRIFDAIMQHGQVSAPGSAHDLVERIVLDPSKDETGLLHDQRDEPGSPAYCTVQVAIGVIR